MRGPGTIRYFGINIIQHEDFTVTVHGDDELKALGTYPTSCTRRRNYLEPLKLLELKSFATINSSTYWLGITVAPFCSLLQVCFISFLPLPRLVTFVSNHFG